MTVLIVAHYSSPSPSAFQSARRGYVNPFFVVVLVQNHPGYSTRIAGSHGGPSPELSEQRVEVRVAGSFLTIP
jgi:hypothetical protein